MLHIKRHWSLTQAIEIINEHYNAGSVSSGSARNRQIEAWGQMVGRTRALAELDVAIGLHGSIAAFLRDIRMSRKTLSALREFWGSLPDDKPLGTLHAGLSIDGYVLLEALGSGGHSKVWSVRNPTGSVEAMKILRKPSPYSLERFSSEIELLEMLGTNSGILPIIARTQQLTHKAAQYYWLTLPVAIPILSAIDADSTPKSIVAGIKSLAVTLSSLHKKGISHRDIKPDNIFFWNNRWVLGDFGIASFPDSTSLTVAHKRLGPLHFHAPEMLDSPDQADGASADVYALAKTMWVLLAGQQYPPPGEIRQAVPEMTLQVWRPMPSVEVLDKLLEQATCHVATKRIDMDGFIDALDCIPESD